jgi:hypothetical protein
MLKATIALSVLLTVPMLAQQSKSPDGVAGTWNITLEGHQVALVLEQDGQHVTGALMIMGKDVPVDGAFADSTLTLSGSGSVGSHGDQEAVAMKLTARLKEDGTLEGEMNTPHGPMKWTAERFKSRK